MRLIWIMQTFVKKYLVLYTFLYTLLGDCLFNDR